MVEVEEEEPRQVLLEEEEEEEPRQVLLEEEEEEEQQLQEMNLVEACLVQEMDLTRNREAGTDLK